MKTRFTSITRALAILFIVASFVIPAGTPGNSYVSADPGIMRWDPVMTPEAFPQKTDVDNLHYPGTASADNPKGSETISMAVGNDGKTIAWVVRDFQYLDSRFPAMYRNVLYGSNTSGITATTSKEQDLTRTSGFILGAGNLSLNPLGNGLPSNCYQVVIAPDDPRIMAVTADGTTGGEYGTGFGSGPKRIYLSTDAGATWTMAFDGLILSENESIRNLDISVDYGTKRDIGFVTTRGIGGPDLTKSGRWFVSASGGFSNWVDQTVAPSVPMPNGLNSAGNVDNLARDFYAIKFSPTYNGDQSVALVAATDNGTYYNIAQRDADQNLTLGWSLGTSINVRNSSYSDSYTSPTISTLNNTCVQLPSDFSGQTSSLRRAYISLDVYGYKPNNVVHTKVVGTSTAGSTSLNANTVHYQQFTASASGILTSIYIYATASGSVKVGIYSDSGGVPGTLLASNNAGTNVIATGWQTVPIVPYFNVTAGTKYWLAVLGDTTGAATETTGISGANYYNQSISYAAGLPATATPINHDTTQEVSIQGWGFTITKLIGTSAAGSTSLNANTVHYQQFTASASGILTSIYIYATASGSVKVGIYSDSGGVTGTLLASNNAGTSVTATGWQTVPIVPYFNVTAGTKYWLAVLGDTTGAATETTGISGANYYNQSISYAAGLPATATPINHDTTQEVSIQGWGWVPAIIQDGIYRIDDNTVYVLMDTTQTPQKSIYSIAYFGTYASGKLLAGEHMGFPCTATVPTWFTDSPTSCPVPCWYPALKPTTGAGNQGGCLVGAQNGVGAAIMGWNADGSLGLVSTGSLPTFPSMSRLRRTIISGVMGGAWWGALSDPSVLSSSDNPSQSAFSITADPLDIGLIQAVIHDDESAFAISRNNGSTWNQLSLIDTTIDWFNDVAAAPDCSTIYLASVSVNTGLGCNEFDSVWRSTVDPSVSSPLAAIPPIGTVWERVFCHTTSGSCNITQSELPILRVVESCTDMKDGQLIAWAAQNASASNTSNSGGVMAWSPDFGDYWSIITPRYPVQDFALESSTTIYVLNASGLVQRLPYTGTSWSTNLPNYDTQLLHGHTIAAIHPGRVLVGAALNASYPMAYSLDKGVTFNIIADPIAGHGNEHVIFDVDFANNQFIYMGDDSAAYSKPNNTKDSGGTAAGTVYRNTIPSSGRWVDGDMMSLANGNGYVFQLEPQLWWSTSGVNNPPHMVGQYGLVQAWTGDPQPALYSAHDNITNSNGYTDSAVCRTLKPRDGMPKPGILWACLDVFAPLNQKNVFFTLEPSSLKACGCCTLDTNTTLYAIDNESGMTSNYPNIATPADFTGRWNNHLNDTDTSQWNDHPGYTPTLNQGMLWAFTDCLAKKGPALKSPADKYLIGADPVTGRNQQIDLAWEQLCLTIWYQLQIAKDKDFTLRVNPSVNWGNGSTGVISAVTGSLLMKMDSGNNTSPAAWIPPGSLPEAGAIYYWRIRSAKSATTQIADSPWSETRSFTVKAGFIVNTPYYGVQLLSPNNGGKAIATRPTYFSWSPWKDATKYEFDLARDSEFKQMVTTANTTTTAYSYSGTLDYSTSYFWRVKAIEVNGENIPSDWSAAFSFQTEAAPPPEKPAPAEPAIPLWVWVIIAIGAILVIVTLILILRTRHRI